MAATYKPEAFLGTRMAREQLGLAHPATPA